MNAGNLQNVRPDSREAAVLRQRRWLRSRQSAAAVPFRLIQPLPFSVWMVTGVLALAAVTSFYPMLTLASVLMVPVLASLLLFKGDSPILFACCMMQWLQVTTAIFYCDFKHITTDVAFEYPNMEFATWLSLAGVLVLALAMRLALGRWSVTPKAMVSEARRISLPQLTLLWCAAFIVASISEKLAWHGGGLAQLLQAITKLKWVVFFVLAYQVVTVGKGTKTLVLIMLLQVGIGFLGFYGNFKESLLMFLVAVMSTGRRLSFKARLISLLVILLGIWASIVWSVIKMDFRKFLTESKGTQAPLSVKIERVRDLFSKHDREGGIIEIGIETLVQRVSYTQLFGRTLEYVPTRVPYADGQLWLGAIQHVLMPRMLFPDKAILDDSARAVKYTGLNLAGRTESTSIGIGYMAESYVDFGIYGMFIPIVFLGFLMGRIYRLFASNRHSRLWGVAMGTAVLSSELSAYGTSNVKILGGLCMITLTLWIFNHFLGQKIRAWLSKGLPLMQR